MSNEVFQKIAEKISEQFLSFDKEAVNFVNSKMKELVILGLGLKKSHFGRYEIHKTNGHYSKIIDIIRGYTEATIKQDARKILDELMAHKEDRSSLEKIFRNEYEEAYQSALYNEVAEMVKIHLEEAKQRFSEEAQTFTNKMEQTLDVALEVSRTEIQNTILRRK